MSVLFAIILFSFLIFIHEVGHFAAAKLSGVQVNELSLFMGPVLWQKQVGETMYSLRLIPVGGFCAMEGEDTGSENPRSFHSAAWWKQTIILAAGAFMNFLAGVALLVLVYLPVKQVVVPVIDSFEWYSTVDGERGLREGDRILEVDGEKIYVQTDFNLILHLNEGKYHDLVVEREGKRVILEDFLMEKHEVTDESGQRVLLYGMNFTLEELTFGGKLRCAWYEALDSVRLARLSLQMLFRGKVGFAEVSGPVGIVSMMSDAASQASSRLDAVLNLLFFGGFVAINLAVMNLLPIPALDGGRIVGVLLTTVVESITKKKIDPKYEGYLHGAGMVLLLILMVVVVFKDIFTLFMR